jgi:hypothetical protein
MVPEEEPHPVKAIIEKKTRGTAITLGELTLQFLKFICMMAIASSFL